MPSEYTVMPGGLTIARHMGQVLPSGRCSHSSMQASQNMWPLPDSPLQFSRKGFTMVSCALPWMLSGAGETQASCEHVAHLANAA